MAVDPSETLYTVVIAGIKDADAKVRVTRGLVRVTKNLPVELITARLNQLPWTLTRRAALKKASRLVELLEKLGAEVTVLPPLPAPVLKDAQPTQILPGTTLLSGTQVMGSTQFVEIPEDVPTSSTPRPLLKPPLPEPQVQEPTSEDAEGLDIEPLTLAGILDRTFQICRHHFWKLFAISAIPYLAMAAIGLVAAIIMGVVGLTWRSLGGFPSWVLIVAGIALVPSLLVVFIGVLFLAQGAMIHAISRVYLGRPITVKDAYRFVYNRLGRFFFTTCLFVLASLGFLFLPMIAGSFLFFAFQELTGSGWWSAVTWPVLAILPLYGITKMFLFDRVVIIENGAYGQALKRSWNLISGKADSPWPRSYFLRLVILIHVFFLVWIAIDIIFRVPPALIGLVLSEPRLVINIVNQLMGQLSALVVGIFWAVGGVVFYYDIRSRKEGFDLKMLAEMN